MFPILVPVHGTPFWAPRIEFRRLAWGCNTKHTTFDTASLALGNTCTQGRIFGYDRDQSTIDD